MVRSSSRRPVRSSGLSSSSPPDWPLAVHAISKKLRTGSRSPLVDQCGAAAAASGSGAARRDPAVVVRARAEAGRRAVGQRERRRRRRERAATRPPPIAWLSVWASPCEATRAREPSKSGSTAWSPAAKRCTAPATYAVPTARCSAALSRWGSAVPQVWSDSPAQSSHAGDAEVRGVHSVLKKLWLAPITRTLLFSEVSPATRSRAASVNFWPCRSLTSPSQKGSRVTVGTYGAVCAAKSVGATSTCPTIRYGALSGIRIEARSTPSPPRLWPTSTTWSRSTWCAAARPTQWSRCACTSAGAGVGAAVGRVEVLGVDAVDPDRHGRVALRGQHLLDVVVAEVARDLAERRLARPVLGPRVGVGRVVAGAVPAVQEQHERPRPGGRVRGAARRRGRPSRSAPACRAP